MAFLDWFDYDDMDERDGTEEVTCKRCTTGGLRWDWEDRWVLLNPDGSLHRCHEVKLAAFSAFLRRMKT